MRLRNIWVSLLGLALAASVVACGGGSETSSTSAEPAAPAAAPAGQKVDAATAGDVKGVVTLRRHGAENEPIKMNADPGLREGEQGAAAQETYRSAATASRSPMCSCT